MTTFSPEVQQLAFRAQPHYIDALPYHNWQHALDVMEAAYDLGSRAVNPDIAKNTGLLVIAAAWHDADYHLPDSDEFATKEERSAVLANKMLPELSEADRELLMSGILDTTVAIHPKSSLFGAVLHAADLGHFAGSPEHFLSRLSRMRREWGSPSWEVTLTRSIPFGHTVIAEAEELMPQVLSPTDATAWVESIQRNLNYLQSEFDAGNLTD